MDELQSLIRQTLSQVPVTDIHTHIYSSAFDDLLLWGIDDLLTYHYLVTEFFRYSSMEYAAFFSLPKERQADLIWRTLFLEHSPISEGQRGVLTALSRLGLDLSQRDLNSYREYFASLSREQYIDRVFDLANVKEVVMTNDPFDPSERKVWEEGGQTDPRFLAALRIDPLLNEWTQSYKHLQAWGYQVDLHLDQQSLSEVRRFLTDWVRRMRALYMAVSLPPTFSLPEDSCRSRLIHQCVLPVCQELDIPFAMMIGVNRQVNPGLRLAGDSLGRSQLQPIEYLCREYPRNRFMVTMLSRENQHELAVTARKFRNLMVFGCWWFLNSSSLVREITQMRLETLGLSFIPQHSDARVLDQLIYKWDHSRKVIAEVLYEKYKDLAQTSWRIRPEEIHRDASDLLSGNFWSFLG